MKRDVFETYLKENEDSILRIKERVRRLHDIECNQKYGEKVYSFHLNMVADYAMKWGHYQCFDESDIMPIVFAAYFHDSIEDARVTYNDVFKIAREYMDENQAKTAVEIVYALTDEKGRNRAERGSDKHYADIRNTLFAPFVKFCDRYANYKYSFENGSRMAKVYDEEMPSFLNKLGYDKYISKHIFKEAFGWKENEQSLT